jgi:hypothetical protein
MAVSFFNNLEEVKDLSNEAAAAMPKICLMGCDCIKSTKYGSGLALCFLQCECDAIRQTLKKYSTKNYDRFLSRMSDRAGIEVNVIGTSE